jgi:hypothetical protein
MLPISLREEQIARQMSSRIYSRAGTLSQRGGSRSSSPVYGGG